MMYRNPKDIDKEWLDLGQELIRLKLEYEKVVERIDHKRRLLEAEKVLAREYYHG